MAAMADRLYRSREDRMLAGVAAGVAEALDADPSLVRVAWALLTVATGGVALLVYIVMAIVVPEAPAGWSAAAEPASATQAGAAFPTGGTADAPGAAPTQPSAWATERDARRAARRARREAGDTRGGLIAGLALIVIGGIFLLRQIGVWFDWDLWWPVALIGLGALLMVFAVFPGRRSD
jgi:phage shock protein PspC (stress-responsive transcriptional regulator)